MARRFKREAKTLKDKAIASLKIGLEAFNSFREDGRQTATLLHLQHAGEMLLKAALIQRDQSVFDNKNKTSIGFEKCVNLASQRHTCDLTVSDAGTLRAIDSLRDAEQHWLVIIEEAFLFLHIRALVTIFDEVLQNVFEERLADHLPARVLPISTHPITDFDVLVGREFAQVHDLLQPGRRQRDEARGRIRTLLAMEAHSAEDVDVSERDIDRVERAIKSGSGWEDTFPRLVSLSSTIEGEGSQITVKFHKTEGAPVRYVGADDPEHAAAVREIDLQRKYRYSATELARQVKLTPPKSKVLRDFLGIDTDASCCHVFKFGKQKLAQFSDAAVQKMRVGLKENDIAAVWKARKQ